ncbi:hypothetical protein OB988_18790 [Bacillus cereus]|nr:hypothetical protein [Bacillus cereus]
MKKVTVDGINIYLGEDEFGDQWRVNEGGDGGVYVGIYKKGHNVEDIDKGMDYMGALSLTRSQAIHLRDSITASLIEEEEN